MSLNELTAAGLSSLLREKEISCRELLDAVFARISRRNEKINAFITLAREQAYRQADILDEKRSRGEELPPLAGIPAAVKDNICVEGLRTTCASKMLENFIPPYNAHVIDRMLSAGMIITGKTNLDEFAMGSSTETSLFGPTRNPCNTDMTAGGSSGGSAAAVADFQSVLGLGSDTGGSIRQPAAFCGAVGLKPTYGAVSRNGAVAFASSLDQVGPIARTVGDAALFLNVLAGHDPMDSTSVPMEHPDYSSFTGQDVKGMKAALPDEYFVDGLSPAVKDNILRMVKLLEGEGVEVERVSLPHTEYAVPAYYIIATAEASSNLARFDGVKYGHRAENAESLLDMYIKTRSEGFGAEVKRRLMLGTYVLSSGYYDAYYLKAIKVRTLVRNEFDECFKKYDCIITPTTPTPAFGLGEKIKDPLAMYLNDIFTIPSNLAGLPAVSVPCGLSPEGLPVGMQFMARRFGEGGILKLAHACERLNGGGKDE